MKRVASDGWFQMFAAIAGLAAVVSMSGTIRARGVPAAPAPSVAAAPAAPAAASSPDPVPEPARAAAALPAGNLTPPAAPVPAPPAAAPAPAQQPAPQMTLVGAGVGNAQGMPAAPGAGIAGFINGLMGRQAQPLQPAVPASYVRPAKAGVFEVDASGAGDTRSLRDAAYSAGEGDVIRVKPGTYDGPVEIVDKTVSISGLGPDPGAVTIRHSGRAAAVVVRGGGLTMENVRVMYGTSNEFPAREPHGALYAAGAAVRLKRVELGTPGLGEPALIAERGDKPTSLSIEDSELMGGRATVLLRGVSRARFVRTRIAGRLPVAAWLESAVDLTDCRFDAGPETVIKAYEGARATVAGSSRPRVDGSRGSEATAIEAYFGSNAATARRGFSRDIFRRGRQPGTLP